jgi:7-cyano-7-deazaguanine synthase
MRAAVCFSGGMDSTTLATMYLKSGYSLDLLSFNYGQRHRRRELGAAEDVAAHLFGLGIAPVGHKIVDLSSLAGLLPGSSLTDSGVDVPDGHYAEESMRMTVVPNRNAIMANIAIGIASASGADIVAMGMHAGDHAVYPDCRPEFVKSLRQTMVHALKGFHTPRLETPFLRMTKTQIAETGALLGAPLGLSWSCYKGGSLHCGTCGTCTERKEAFKDAGLTDPTEYLA